MSNFEILAVLRSQQAASSILEQIGLAEVNHRVFINSVEILHDTCIHYFFLG